MRKSIHGNKEELFCNRCEKYINKHIETLVIEEQVHCIHCDNWLCGEYDAFEIIESPSIEHIKITAQQ